MRLASLCYRALALSGLTTVTRRLSRRGLILCYHNVVAGAEAGAWDNLGLHMPLATFARQMRWLTRNYHVRPLAEFVSRVAERRSLRGMAAVTFDDGYSGVFEHAWPVLRDLSIPATVFVVADAPGRDEGFWWDRGPGSVQPPSWCKPAGWQTIATAARSGLRVGVHSATHRSLPTLGELELERELVESRDIIRSRTGESAEFFAYPYGLWNDRVRGAVRSAGYRAAFTLEYGRDTTTDAWAFPRMNVPAQIEDAAFHAWTAGLNLRRGRSA